MSNIKFSIIIPVYNVEEYLDRCVKSVINQSYRNIEIIMVDDGSPDKCPEMCDRYAEDDSRIVVIHKPNGGLSDARNAGIRAATGDYIIFLDSDDSLEITCCEQICNAIEEIDSPDIVICNTKRIENDQISVINRYPKCEAFESGAEFLTYCFSSSTDFCMLSPNNIYKRSLIVENGIYFKEGILHEDERWTPIAILNAKKVLNTNITHYNYFIRGGSITTSVKKRKNAIDLIDTVNYLSHEYEKIENKTLKRYMKNYLSGLYLYAVYIGDLSSEKEYIDKKLCLKLSKTLKNRIKSAIFLLSPRLYCLLRKGK